MERLLFSPPYLHVEHHERIPALDPGVEAARLLAYARMSAATPGVGTAMSRVNPRPYATGAA